MNRDELKLGIESAFYRVFPESHIWVSRGTSSWGRELWIQCYLQKPGEWSNKISQNDPLNYSADIDPDTMLYTEHRHTLTVLPDNNYMAYGVAKLRKRNIKNADIEKIEARFEQLKAFIVSNLDNAAHDIRGKVS